MARESKIWYWKARDCYYTTIQGKQYKLSRDYREAKRMLKPLVRELEQPQRSGRAVYTFDVIQEVLNWVRQHRSAATHGAYKQRCQWFMDEVGDIPVSELTTQTVLKWTNKENWSDGMKWTCIGTLKTVFNRAVKMGLIPENPVRHAERPSPGKREHLLTPDEHEKILSHVTDDAFRDLLTVAWECGPRPQELLRVEARHFEEKQQRWVFEVSESKNKRRKRVVFLTPEAVKIIPSGFSFLSSRSKASVPSFGMSLSSSKDTSTVSSRSHGGVRRSLKTNGVPQRGHSEEWWGENIFASHCRQTAYHFTQGPF